MINFLSDAPNWVKPLPGLLLLGGGGVAYLNGYIWPFGFIFGALLLTAGLLLWKEQ